MRARSVASIISAVIAGLASGALFAQPSPPTVTVGFVGPLPVPLDPWSSLAAGLLIAAAAYAFFRRSGAGRFGRLSAWLAVIAAAAGVVIGASRIDVVATAHAVSGTPLPLTTSPASLVIGGESAFIEARNATGTTVTITEVRLDNAAPGQAIVETTGSCVAGLILAVGQSCFVSVQTDVT
jgi:hypothetical protein